MAALFVKHLTVLDFSLLHPQRGILGESWIVDVELAGDLNDEGMVFDFAHVKKAVKAAVQTLFDHKLLVSRKLPSLTIEEKEGYTTLSWQGDEGQYHYQAPTQAITLVDCDELTPEALIPALQQIALDAVPENVTQIKIHLRTEEIAGAFYQYSHGLKKHQGDCQRMVHGHRSRIKILRNGKRDPLLEKAWGLKWKDIYIGTEEDVTGSTEQSTTFSYQAQQGKFELTLPSKQVYLLNCDTTVELLAQHIAQTLKQDDPEHDFEVHAYEGVMKGAIARA